jgi:hypothetical protein
LCKMWCPCVVCKGNIFPLSMQGGNSNTLNGIQISLNSI